eukprot:3243638-Prymnesium_polylepis.1
MKVIQDAKGSAIELRSGFAHGTADHPNRIGHVGTGVNSTVEQRAHETLVGFKERRVDVRRVLSKSVGDQLRETMATVLSGSARGGVVAEHVRFVEFKDRHSVGGKVAHHLLDVTLLT